MRVPLFTDPPWPWPLMLASMGVVFFAGISPQAFRRHVLNLPALIAAVTVLRALYGLWFTACYQFATDRVKSDCCARPIARIPAPETAFG